MGLTDTSLSATGVRTVDASIRRVKRLLKGMLAVCGYEVDRTPGLKLRRRVCIGNNLLSDVKLILGRGLHCMIDGGAHFGETALYFADEFPDALIFSFEPTREAVEEFRRNTRTYANIKLINACLGEKSGTAILHVNNNCETNSLLETAEEASRWTPAEVTMEKMTVEVPVYALDDFVPEQINRSIDLLKLDVQGYELMVLQGAARLLDRATFPLIYLEICYVPQYRDQPSLPDLYSLLYGYGYRLVSTYPSEFDGRGYKYRVGGDLLFVHESYGNGSPNQLSKRDN
jgi:FkbM family methyltransferase